jgi:hypothetical protein
MSNFVFACLPRAPVSRATPAGLRARSFASRRERPGRLLRAPEKPAALRRLRALETSFCLRASRSGPLRSITACGRLQERNSRSFAAPMRCEGSLSLFGYVCCAGSKICFRPFHPGKYRNAFFSRKIEKNSQICFLPYYACAQAHVASPVNKCHSHFRGAI